MCRPDRCAGQLYAAEPRLIVLGVDPVIRRQHADFLESNLTLDGGHSVRSFVNKDMAKSAMLFTQQVVHEPSPLADARCSIRHLSVRHSSSGPSASPRGTTHSQDTEVAAAIVSKSES